MRVSVLSRYALISCVAAAMLAGCGVLRQAQDDTRQAQDDTRQAQDDTRQASYVESSVTNVQMWQNWKNATGNGLVVFSW